MPLKILTAVGNAAANASMQLTPGILTHLTVSTDAALQEPTMTNAQVIIHPGDPATTEPAHQLMDGWIDNFHPLLWNGMIEIHDGDFIRLRRTGFSEVTIVCTWQIIKQSFEGALRDIITNAVRTTETR